ncbi:phage portal protein [Bifidobacterium xylocopae]|uniref:Phage portal protein n=2 Tax=Bifidobacterium xylocopae TaxID=2493119 RepID=A0A366KH93_9BIFI|nr:phage portal protein [Bifidobacterium xylocopae]
MSKEDGMIWPFTRRKQVEKSVQDFQAGTVRGRWYVVDPGMPLSANSEALSVFSTQPSVRKTVEFVARNAARIPMKVYRRDGDNDRPVVTSGPLYDLVKYPTRYHGAYRFWYDLICDLLIYDRFAIKLLPSASTRSGYELYRLPAYSWTFTWSGYEDVHGIQLSTADSHSATIGLDGILWDKGYGSANGVSPMRTLSQTLREYAESVKWRQAIWQNGARIPGIFAMDADMKPLERGDQKRLETDINDYLENGGHEGRSPVLQGIHWEKVESFSPKDAQEVEGRTLADIEVASAYHVPPEMVGAREADYSSTQAFRDSLYKETLGPLFTQLEQAFNAQIVPLVSTDPREYVEFDLNAALRGSFLEQAEILQKAVGGPYLSINEGRKEQGFPGLGPEYDQIIDLLNTVRGGGPQADPTDSGSQNIGGSQ